MTTEREWNLSAGTTHWSQLRPAGASEEARQTAYAYFYERYRGAIYRYLRFRGVSRGEAGDRTHDFFVRCLGGSFLERADPDRGRFRAFLKTAMERFLIDQWRRAGARPRTTPISGLGAEDWSRFEPVDGLGSPEEAFDREWARAVVAGARAIVGEWYASRRRPHHFEAFVRRLDRGESSREIGRALDIPEERVDAICLRARERVAREIRIAVAATVGDPGDVEAEIEYLLSLLA